MGSRLRVGGSWSQRGGACTIAEHDQDDPDPRGGALVGMATTTELAREIVAAVNAGRELGVSRSDPGRSEVADRLVEAALFLRMHGERPPGAPIDPTAETWTRWDREAEMYLRSREAGADA